MREDKDRRSAWCSHALPNMADLVTFKAVGAAALAVIRLCVLVTTFGAAAGAGLAHALSEIPRHVSTDPDNGAQAISFAASSYSRLLLDGDRTGSMSPGQAVRYTLEVRNLSSRDVELVLSARSSAGFSTALTDELGHQLPSTVTVRALSSVRFWAHVSVTPTAPVGLSDRTIVTAVAQWPVPTRLTAELLTTVRPPLTVEPSVLVHASPGDTVRCSHIVTNAWPETRTVEISSTSTSGWPLIVVDEASQQITTMTLGPAGGQAEFVVELSVPVTASTPATALVLLSGSVGSGSVTATDTVVIRRLYTYEDPAHEVRSWVFRPFQPIYARATALDPGSSVCFTWRDPAGVARATSGPITVDETGTAAHAHTVETTGAAGTWTLELRENDASGPVIEVSTFDLTYRGAITSLYASDGPEWEDTITVTASVANLSSDEITGSQLVYLLWWDADGNDLFDPGDTYIDSQGRPQPFALEALTHTTELPDLPAGATWSEPTPWSVSNRDFPEQGLYNCTASWLDSRGHVIDERTAEFYSIPTLGWPLYLLTVGTTAYLLWRNVRLLGLRSCDGASARFLAAAERHSPHDRLDQRIAGSHA